MNRLEFRLLNEFQRDFPLVPAPYQTIGERLGTEESWVLAALTRGLGDGRISRIGAVFRPGATGASTLAAMAVPRPVLSEVAARVGRHAGVNHNYEREHPLNLWFVAAAVDESRLSDMLADIEGDTGIEVLRFPLEREYHIDLGFDLARSAKRIGSPAAPATPLIEADARQLIAALQQGLALVPRPFRDIAGRCGRTETETLNAVATWQRDGTIRRFGIIVRHRELGYRANAMVVWDVQDARVDSVGERLAEAADVHLCYRRSRRPPRWPFNLYCMVHGREREVVLDRVEQLSRLEGLAGRPRQVLFSRRRFKQTGPRNFEAAESQIG